MKSMTCYSCKGKGHVSGDVCYVCGGLGKIPVPAEPIPPPDPEMDEKPEKEWGVSRKAETRNPES